MKYEAQWWKLQKLSTTKKHEKYKLTHTLSDSYVMSIRRHKLVTPPRHSQTDTHYLLLHTISHKVWPNDCSIQTEKRGGKTTTTFAEISKASN